MSLAALILSRYRDYPGAREHQHIASLLSRARGHRLSAEVVDALVWVLTEETDSFEKNVDVALPPEQPIWIEFSNDTRLKRHAYGDEPIENPPIDVGYLFAAEDGSDKITLVTAWSLRDAEGQLLAVHSMAACHIDANELGTIAWEARRSRKGPSVEVFERLAGASRVVVPENFRKEIAIAVGDARVDATIVQIRQDIVSELPFALATLVFLSTPEAEVGEPPEKGLPPVELKASAASIPLSSSESFLRKFLRRDAREQPSAFARIGAIADRKVRLDLKRYRPPTAIARHAESE